MVMINIRGDNSADFLHAWIHAAAISVAAARPALHRREACRTFWRYACGSPATLSKTSGVIYDLPPSDMCRAICGNND
jgi:hypothetical protein